jgi:hypothetical protein
MQEANINGMPVDLKVDRQEQIPDSISLGRVLR